MGPTWGPSRADKTVVGLMLAPWTLPSGSFEVGLLSHLILDLDHINQMSIIDSNASGTGDQESHKVLRVLKYRFILKGYITNNICDSTSITVFSEKNYTYKPFCCGSKCLCRENHGCLVCLFHYNCSKAWQHHTFDDCGIAWEIACIGRQAIDVNILHETGVFHFLSLINNARARAVITYPHERPGFGYDTTS